MLRDDVLKLVNQHGHELVQSQLLLLQNGVGGRANPWAVGSIPCDEVGDAEEVHRLWNFCLYPQTTCMVIGETYAGKSTIMYNQMLAAAMGEPIWGIPWEMGRPLRILYIDKENAGRKRSQKLARLQCRKPSNLVFHDARGVDLADENHMQQLNEYVIEQRFDIVVIDTLLACFGVVNENDNAEAQRHMNLLNGLANDTGACVVVTHHTDKTGTGNYGRGAGARLGAVDVAFMVRSTANASIQVDDTFRGQSHSREDIVRYQVVKNRIEGEGSIYLQMIANDRFGPSSYAAWKDSLAKAPDMSKQVEVDEAVFTALCRDGYASKVQLYSQLAQDGHGRAVVEQALDNLVAEGTAYRQRVRGVAFYALISSEIPGACTAQPEEPEEGIDDPFATEEVA